MAKILEEADKANGYCFHQLQERQLAELEKEMQKENIE